MIGNYLHELGKEKTKQNKKYIYEGVGWGKEGWGGGGRGKILRWVG